MKIAIDAMGGDNAPRAIIEGAVDAIRTFGHSLVLVGHQTQIEAELKRLKFDKGKLDIHHADEVIGMGEPAAQSVRRKKNASISIAADLVKRGLADAIITAGNTGAAVAASTLKMRLLDGIERPGIGITLPNLKNDTFLIDVGANIECKPIHFYQYALMGNVYSKYILGKKNPKVGILNVGEEISKGTESIRQAHVLLEKSGLNFIGNVEGRDIYNGHVDIVVCDGFVGNVVLKVSESIAAVVAKMLKKKLKTNYLTMVGALLSQSAFKAYKREVDYAEYGGAPLLGVKGICIISHGSSGAKAIKNAIRVAAEFVKHEINQHIISENQTREIFA